MRLVVPLIAGVWLFVTGVQGVAFLVQYGLLPLPPEFGRLDFTPQYTVLMGLVILGAVLVRTVHRAPQGDATPGKRVRR